MLTLTAAASANAQSVGTFSWQQQPYCNVLTLNVVQSGGLYHLDGFDDQCGAGRRASAAGVGFVNPNGSIGFGLTVVTNDGNSTGGAPLHIDVTVSLASVSGTWRDSAGGSGAWTFAPTGGRGGAPRPLPNLATQPGPNSVGTAALATRAVTSDKLALDSVTGLTVADGSLTVADIQDAPRIAFVQGEQLVALQNGTPTSVRSLAIAPVAAGHLMLSATGTFDRSVPYAAARCSISTGTEIEPAYATVTSGEPTGHVPFAITRVLAVVPGVPVTVHLVCDKFSGSVDALNTRLVALFIAGS